VLSVPVMPDPALTGPVTGGQKVAQDPLHLEVVEVSGTNKYRTKPLELVRTVVPLMVVVASAGPDPPAAALFWAAGVVAAALVAAALVAAAPVLELLELPHAATASAIAASPVAAYMFFILDFSPS
jgi:hypothetical protein